MDHLQTCRNSKVIKVNLSKSWWIEMQRRGLFHLHQCRVKVIKGVTAHLKGEVNSCRVWHICRIPSTAASAQGWALEILEIGGHISQTSWQHHSIKGKFLKALPEGSRQPVASQPWWLFSELNCHGSISFEGEGQTPNLSFMESNGWTRYSTLLK